MNRPLCIKCNKPAAINYHKDKKIYYRKKCESCLYEEGGIKKKIKPRWEKAGYKKKSTCEKCGFKAKYSKQLSVFFIDGNLNNINILNLKTVCANCLIDLSLTPGGWRIGDLKADF